MPSSTRTRSKSADCRRSSPTSTGSRRSRTKAPLRRRSAIRFAPTPIRSTIPITTPKICSGFSSPRRSMTRPDGAVHDAGRPRTPGPRLLSLPVPDMAKIRADYTPYVARSSPLPAFPTPQRAGRIVALETKIAQAHETLEASQESTTGRQSVDPRRLRQESSGCRLGPAARRGPARRSAGLRRVAARGRDQDRRAGRRAAARGVEGLARVPPDQPANGRVAQGVRRRAFRLLRHRDCRAAPAADARQARARIAGAPANRELGWARDRQALRRQIFPGVFEGRHRRHGEEHQGRARETHRCAELDGAAHQRRSQEEGRDDGRGHRLPRQVARLRVTRHPRRRRVRQRRSRRTGSLPAPAVEDRPSRSTRPNGGWNRRRSTRSTCRCRTR